MKTQKLFFCLLFRILLGSKKKPRNFILALLFLAFTLPGFSQQKAVSIGTVASFYESLKPSTTNAKQSAPLRKALKVKKGESVNFSLHHNQETPSGEVFIGKVNNQKNSHAFFTYKNGSVHGKIILPDEKKAYAYSSKNGAVFVVPEDIHNVICMEYQKTEALLAAPVSAAAVAASLPNPTSPVFSLQSLPGATAVVLLDFDGHDATGSNWGNINALPASATEQDIEQTWQLVSEDYRPYQLNITTSEAVYQAAPANRRMRCVITPTTDAQPGYSGVAFINSFTTGGDLAPCWVFDYGNFSAKSIGEVASHEIGHTMGLLHDGLKNPDGTTAKEYYGGHMNWGTIMGNGTQSPVSQWSKGEYKDANNFQDDVVIIGTLNGFGFRTDDVGNTSAASKQMIYAANGDINTTANVGVIENRTDVDVYRFTTTGGTAVITVGGTNPFPNLDVELTLRNSSGVLMGSANQPATMAATLSSVLPAGTYYLTIDGVGYGDPLLTGYSDYASIGQYTISGNIQLANTPPTVSLVTPVNGAYLAAPATFELSASVNDLEGPIAKVEFYQDNVKIGEDAFYPGFGWMVNNLPQGTYTFTAKAFDQGGMSTVSAPVTIIVDGTPPTISILTPANNAQFTAPASFSLIVSVTDGQGPIKKVEFYQNNVKIGEDAFYPGFGWELVNLPAGTYVFTAKAFDQASNTTVTSPITVVVNPNPCLVNEPIPPAAQYTLRNTWWDQQSGSTVSNESDALKVSHRAYGKNELWVLETGKTISVTNGQVYNVKLDFKDFASIGVTGMEVGYATGIAIDGSGPVIAGTTVNFPAGFSSANFTTKSVNLTSAVTGNVFLALKLKWANQPTAQVITYLKNILVCAGAGTASKIDLAENTSLIETSTALQGLTIRPNPAEGEFYASVKRDVASFAVMDLQGKTLYNKEQISQDSELKFGDGFQVGFYIVQVKYNDGSMESFKIIKTK